MFNLPYSLAATATLLIASFSGIGLSFRLLARRKLTMAYALVWMGAFLGMALLLTVPSLLSTISHVLQSASPEGALRLMAMTLMVGFLMFFSVKISTMSNRLEELAQRVGLMEYALEERMGPRGAASAAKSET